MSDNNDTEHLSNLSDGAGCTEIWEHLSEQRAAAAEESEETTDADADAADETETDSDDAEQDAAAEVPCP